MAGVISLAAFIAVVLVISFVVYYFIYNKRINERIKNQESMVHNSMASVDTIGKFLTVFFGVAMVFILFGELNGLKSDIEAEQESLSSQIACVEEYISELETKMNQQNSLVSSFQCTVGERNTKDKTVELQFVCTPKMYSKDTKLMLVNGDKEIKFTYGEDGNFKAKKTFSMFESFEEESVIRQEDHGVIRTSIEKDIMAGNLANDCLPELGEGASMGIANIHGKVKISGNVLLPDEDNFQNVELYVLRNGKRIENVNGLNYTDDEPSFEVTVDVDEDDSVCVVLSGVDNYGFIHKKILVGQNIDDEQMEGYASIYDTEGNLLSGVEIE